MSGGILFTAFEPSGDALAADVIARLREEAPDLPIRGVGGPHMAEAGAELLERTTDRPSMLASAVKQAGSHWKRLRRLRRDMQDEAPDVLVPVDSPAANWSVCKAMRRKRPGGRIVHLTAPQLWAWGNWRLKKLRNLTDDVLCLLPFEPDWFQQRQIPAHFVGHPAFGRAIPSRDLEIEDGPMLVVMPGSRDAELKANTPIMHRVASQLVGAVPGLRVCTAAPSARAAGMLRRLTRDPFNVTFGGAIRVGETEKLLRRADAALVVSGTATLEAAAHEVPMVAMYRTSYLAWQLAGRFLVSTRTFTLPNLIAEREGIGRVIPEFVPHFADPEPLRRELEPLLTDAKAREKQREGLRRIRQPFEGVDFAGRAAERIHAHLETKGSASSEETASAQPAAAAS